jgi:hypothetical protein
MTDVPTNVLASLKATALGTLTSSLKDIVDTTKAEVQAFLSTNAEQMAEQTFLSVSGTPEERDQASDNMAALKAQAVMEGCDAIIVDSAKALALLVKVIETVANFMIQNAPALLAAIPK